MKIIIYFCLALSPFIIHCTSPQREKPSKVKRLEGEMHNNNGRINNIFEPSDNGCLDTGGYGIVYKGKLHYPGERPMDVAMKFTSTLTKSIEGKAKKEYEIYSCLNAIDNPQVELYGIPSVYYHGHWNGYIMIGMTLLESNLEEIIEKNQHNTVDLLIVCKQFMMASKYIHSCGIYHGDIDFNNIMFRGNDAFFIDYNRAGKMYEETEMNPISRESGIEYAKTDWKGFVQAIYDYSRIDKSEYFEIFKYNTDDPEIGWETEEEASVIMEQLETMTVDDEIKMICIEMAKYILEKVDPLEKNDKTSVYDLIYGIIEKKINKLTKGEIPLVSWLAEVKKENAREEYRSKPSILKIPDPTKLAVINYPKAVENFFDKKIWGPKSGESSTGKVRSSFSTSGSSKFGNEQKRRH